jgi:hypothetical protein
MHGDANRLVVEALIAAFVLVLIGALVKRTLAIIVKFVVAAGTAAIGVGIIAVVAGVSAVASNNVSLTETPGAAARVYRRHQPIRPWIRHVPRSGERRCGFPVGRFLRASLSIAPGRPRFRGRCGRGFLSRTQASQLPRHSTANAASTGDAGRRPASGMADSEGRFADAHARLAIARGHAGFGFDVLLFPRRFRRQYRSYQAVLRRAWPRRGAGLQG